MIILPTSLEILAHEVTEIADSLVQLIKTCKLESTALSLGAAHNSLRSAAYNLEQLAERLTQREKDY